jgi:uncharacterized protein (TIGR02001 family)
MAKRNTLARALGAAGIALTALAGPALADGYSAPAPAAEEGRKFGYTWTVTGASDYLFRGISYTQSDPPVNSYLEFTYGIAYLAFWASNIDTGDCSGCLCPYAQDVYLGIRPVTGPVSWDLAVFYYAYATKDPDNTGISWTDTDYVEFKLGGSITPITNLSLVGTAYWTPDQDVASPENISVEGTIAYTLPAWRIFTPTISGQIGFSDASTNSVYGTTADGTGYWNGDDQYTYWNAGVKFAVEKFTFDLRYWDTNIETDAIRERNSDERFFFSAAVTLP